MIESLPGETWLPVPGWEGLYQVSDHGRVYSEPRMVRHWRTGELVVPRQGRILKLGKYRNHFGVVLQRDGVREVALIHRLVLTVFVGQCPDGMQGCHRDDDPLNNLLTNLRWGTPSENNLDAVRNGLHAKANQTHCIYGHKFTVENTYIKRNGCRNCRQCRRDRRVRNLLNPNGKAAA